MTTIGLSYVISAEKSFYTGDSWKWSPTCGPFCRQRRSLSSNASECAMKSATSSQYHSRSPCRPLASESSHQWLQFVHHIRSNSSNHYNCIHTDCNSRSSEWDSYNNRYKSIKIYNNRTNNMLLSDNKRL